MEGESGQCEATPPELLWPLCQPGLSDQGGRERDREREGEGEPLLAHNTQHTQTHTHNKKKLGPRGGHYHMTKALLQFIFFPVYFPFAFLESCCITEVGNSDVPLNSQWKVLT